MIRVSALLWQHIFSIVAVSVILLTQQPAAHASLVSKTLESSIVYRVSQDGTPVVAGMLERNVKVVILGYRPDFNWVRIRFDDDEGYVLKSTIEDPQLPKPYFDPEGDKLGRHKKGGNYDYALMNARKFGHFRPVINGMLGLNKQGNMGFGGGAMIRSMSLAGFGHDIGLDGLLYFSEGAPFTASLFYRFWMGGTTKIGVEGAGSVTFVRFVNPDGSTFTETSSAFLVGALAEIPLKPQISLIPGIRFELTGSHNITGVASIAYSFR